MCRDTISESSIRRREFSCIVVETGDGMSNGVRKQIEELSLLVEAQIKADEIKTLGRRSRHLIDFFMMITIC